VPDDHVYDDYVRWRRNKLASEARADPSCAVDSQLWQPLFVAERKEALDATIGSYGGPYN
jgi:hypothetical protein